MSTSILPTITRPCPTWCTLPAGHGWESIFTIGGRENVQRYHVRAATRSAIGDDALQVDIMDSETVPCDLAGVEDPHAASTTTTPRVAVVWPESPANLTADDARRLAVALGADLRGAALELDRIAGHA